jgi:competence protein ComEA
MENGNATNIFTELLLSLRPHIIPVSLACIGLILIGYGVIVSFMHKSSDSPIVFESEDTSVKKMETKEENKKVIVIDVSGAVKKPGVYRIADTARMQDAIVAAGGFSADADLEWTQHSLNLAAKVSDGTKIYIPKMEESIPSNRSSEGSNTGVVAGAATTGLISINSASSTELESLPGIGPVSAGKIIDNRPYASLDELLSKKTMGKSVFQKIKTLISL